MGKRAAALEALPDLTTQPERQQQMATGTNGQAPGASLCTSLRKQRTSDDIRSHPMALETCSTTNNPEQEYTTEQGYSAPSGVSHKSRALS